MKLAMIWANVEEDKEATIIRFVNGLNHDITRIVKLHHYMELEEMVHMVVKVEKQLKQKGTNRQSQLLSPLRPWKPNWKANTKGGPS
jgi:hypothetical protein